jgi:protein O-GlcNAc transferase
MPNPKSRSANPANPQSSLNKAQLLFQQGRQARQQGDLLVAQGLFRQAIQLEPTFVPPYNNLANLLQAAGQIEEAIAIYEQALQLAPNLAVLHCNLASLWQIQGEHDRAIVGYQRAIELQPDFVVAYQNLGESLVIQNQLAAATRAFEMALELDPKSGDYMKMGDLYQRQGLIKEAIDCFRSAVRDRPSAPAYNNLGAALWSWGETKFSKKAYQKALALDPDYDAAHFNMGQLLEGTGELEAAQQHYEKALALQPEAINVLYHLNHLRLRLADWDDYPGRVAELIEKTERHLDRPISVGLPPMTLAAFPVPLALQAAVARHQAQTQTLAVAALKADLPQVPLDLAPARLRIGYVSPDFRSHAVGSLIYQMFQYHQRPEFEIFAYSLIPVEDDWTKVIRAGCDHYIEMAYQAPLAIAQRIQADGIHILIDLAGYTTNSCTAVFALQPAPIQMQYLGYPGTMGADFIQYIVADEQLIPVELAEHYSEKVLYLPQAWVAAPMGISDLPLSREELGLPVDGVVFCCFNGSYKIDPGVFQVWMNILRQVPGSVLWLVEGQPIVATRFRQQAMKLGVDPDRLVFATNALHAEYLARYRLADLFLDTFVYNAGATAVGALWAGLPVLTCPGENYVARMGAELCSAVGLSELICGSIADYERLAINLAHHPQQLQALRAKLNDALADSPLFQPQIFIQNLEQALRRIWQEYLGDA